jgi:hypothetical protein
VICKPCKFAADENAPAYHNECDGPTRCDCQHKPKGTGIAK